MAPRKRQKTDECSKKRKELKEKIEHALKNQTTEDLGNELKACKVFTGCVPKKSSHNQRLHIRDCEHCFAHALVRLYDASLDWKLVHGSQFPFQYRVVFQPVFAALFRKIGNSTIPRGEKHIEARIQELRAEQDEIIKKYRKMAGDILNKLKKEEPVKTDPDRWWMTHRVMAEADLYPGPYRVRKCSLPCKDCRKKIDDAVDWLERDENQGKQPTNAQMKKDISNLRDGIEGHRAILRGRRPKKYYHITRCEPCYFYSMLKTCGTKRAGRELVGADARRDARDGTEFPNMDATIFEDLERGQTFMRLARRGRGHYIN
jgi:hypothetical protein